MFIKIDEKNRVLLQSADRYTYNLLADGVTTFRVNESDIPPTVSAGEFLCFDPNTRAFYTEKVELTDEQRERIRARAAANRKRERALKWLSDNDWKVNKHTLGEWSGDDVRWIEYLQMRCKMREDIDAADAILMS
jgi:hypothetical protein